VATSDDTADHFGLLIAYVLPGFTALQGLPFLAPYPVSWGQSVPDTPGLTSFLSGTLAATAAGLTVSAVRWLLIDTIHHRTGVRPPPWDFARLAEEPAAFALLVRIHYRYYKFYANMVVALVWAYLAGGYALGWRGEWYWILAALFFLGSRDALKKYYDRAGRLLRRLDG
jgi:hypothetical protein